MKNTTLCYLTRDDKVLMLHRTKKHNDVNEGKWIGVGGHVESGESKEMCVRREVWEETGLTLKSLKYRGVIDFLPDKFESERMFLYTSDEFAGEMHECDEGDLKWVEKDQVKSLDLWEGDRIFLKYLVEEAPFFHLKLNYQGDKLVSSELMPRVILASQSPRRRELLEQIDIFPEIIPADVEEFTLETEPSAVVEDLSTQKANATLLKLLRSGQHASDKPVIIIAADTVVVSDGRILGKPASHEKAFEMISALQGRTHEVYTGVTLFFLGSSDGRPALTNRKTFSEMTQVSVYPMSEAEIRAYADSDEPMDKAGAYGIQGSFGKNIREIHGDYTNVVGLPVGRVWNEIKGLWGCN
ncbi:MAG: septum formation protein Maf [Lachnospiraceae bacterium]|uniref:dTTP/UTP pyrophosphatase n=1 Tax=Candidatus Weimeria bifida TaxID=2599074 RepID=A0A6N7IZ11_9FIRM|nr:septum formation protein Maf [Candidatus Weimeria bifida]RRF96642.1 MAG: septum formation protein Maf [Lachnospiraceae bacterium]